MCISGRRINVRWDGLEARCVRKPLEKTKPEKESQPQWKHETGKERMNRSNTSKEKSMALFDWT